MACNTTVGSFQSADGDLEVIEKYNELMQATLGEDSIYTRSKETFKELFDNLQLTEPQKANIVAESIATMTTNLSNSAMQTALGWAKEERDGAYTLAKLKADTEVSLANYEKTKAEICLVEAQTELQCANITATTSASIRDNGTVASYDADGCKVTSLNPNGLKYEQTKQVEAATYQSLADAYRKSGVITIGDGADGVLKGLSDAYPSYSGYTDQQIKNAERQRIAYEDSKVNHAANSISATVGQMLSADVAPDDGLVLKLNNAIDALLSPHSTTATT